MRLKITHTTRYEYRQDVPYGLQQLRLIPVSGPAQTVVNWSLDLGLAEQQAAFRDHIGNEVRLVSIGEGTRVVEIISHGEVDTHDTAGVIGAHNGAAPLWYFERQTDLTRPGPAVGKLLKAWRPPGDDPVAKLHSLITHIGDSIAYETDTSHSETTAESAALAGTGVCQDHTHILIGMARAMGLPARYVSGYLMMDDRTHQDASHAWAEVYVEGLGWVGFDVSNRISPDERYVRIASGLDYREAAPISGFVFGGGKESMIVTLQVQQ
ncbi:transglutaminase family protein [Hyphobacterium sp. HN65]|uniref:Transglutaminase family protein n=1 Tax=Hyphobacterium lacteum TaxID=3116575 RepID=A0ABU7LQB6_9PROT|nr:transglutaminase family protein [Hyphobacterium sp. HN65]MEE2525539.1 transglutaminase family protein [Hyphobacterium sp. HN65]